MSSNETLIAPTPIIDSIDMQTASAAMAEEQAYTYQRADGTVERARNAEDAIARCPVLGKLAIEAPDQAIVLLELATLGNAKMAAEAKEEPKKPTHHEKLAEPKPAKAAAESEKKIPEISTEQLARIKLPVIDSESAEQRLPVIKADSVASYHVGIQRLEKQREESLLAIDNAVEPNADFRVVVSESLKLVTKKENTVSVELPVHNKEEQVLTLIANSNDSTNLSSVIGSEIEQHTQVVTGNDVDTIISESDEPTVIKNEIVNSLDVELEANDTEKALEADSIDAPDFTLTQDSEPSFEPISHEIDAEPDENIEPSFEAETVEAYFEIRDLIADLETSEAIPTEIELESVDTPTFETFLATQAVIEEVTLESIKEQSSERPLEQTLVQLIECLAISTEEDEQLKSLMVIIRDIEKALPNCYVGSEAEETKLQITPEITDKLLTLLRELGYQNPSEALVNIIRKFGFEFLIQSLKYLFQLNDEDNRKEFLSLSSPSFSSDDNLVSRLSKLVLKLVMDKDLLPEAIAA